MTEAIKVWLNLFFGKYKKDLSVKPRGLFE